jgi:serine-type D-Ala-D-Ala carboxypeptidase (penicillin-binding protein 5/6)
MRPLVLLGTIALVFFGAIAFAVDSRISRPLPALAASQLLPDTTTPLNTTVSLPWPKNGSAAVGVDGLGVVDSIRDDKQRPIASVTKMMTAYLILKNHPLRPGETGPTLTISSTDITLYNQMIARDESAVPVTLGQKLTLYELLEGLLIPSGNNFAYLLGAWDAGSVDAFVKKMNDEAVRLGMKNTRYADPSGAMAASVSTATDQVILAQAAMANPVFAEIVLKPQVSLPVAGVLYNTDAILGQQGIIGVKTGWTEEAGGCFVGAARVQIDGREMLVYTAVIGQDTLEDAFKTTKSLIPVLASAPRYTRIVAGDTGVAVIDSNWGKQTQALTARNAEVLLWPGMKVQAELQLKLPNAPLSADDDLGLLVLTAGGQTQSVALRAADALPKPGRFWRLLH